MTEAQPDVMLHCQVSNQLSSLSIKDNNASSTFPMYVSTRDLKLGLTTFWRSPYGTGTRKREFPTVTPSKSWKAGNVLTMNSSAADIKSKGILKNGVPVLVNPNTEESDPSRNKFRKTLRRAKSFTADVSSSQTLKKVQFGRKKSLDVPSISALQKTEVASQPTVESGAEAACSGDTNVVICASTPELRDTIHTPRSTSAVGSTTEPSNLSNTCDSKSAATSPSPSRIPRLCRSYSQLPIKDSHPTETYSNTRNFMRAPNPNRHSPSIRPKTCGGIRSAILPDHTNFCNREQTVRILKWLQEVDDKQTKEGRCMDISSNVELTTKKEM